MKLCPILDDTPVKHGSYILQYSYLINDGSHTVPHIINWTVDDNLSGKKELKEDDDVSISAAVSSMAAAIMTATEVSMSRSKFDSPIKQQGG